MGTSFNIQVLSCIYLLQFSMGLVFEIAGSTLDGLQIFTNSSESAVSLIFSLRSSGYVLGSIVGGSVFHFFVPLISLLFAVILGSLTTASIGLTRNLYAIYAIFTLNGLASGIVDVGTNVWILRLFSDKSGPYIMALYTSFSLGTIIAPLYSAPFLRASPRSMSQLYIPYLVTGLFVLIPLVGLLIIFFKQAQLPYNDRTFFARRTRKPVSRIPSMTDDGEIKKRRIIASSSREKSLIIITVLMIMLYSGIEIVFAEYMVSMLKRSSLRVSHSTASQIRSSANVAYTVGKLIFIGISVFIQPYRIILLDSLLIIFSSIMLITYFNASLVAIWIFSILHGLGESSLYPSIYPFVETFVTIDYFKGSFFICASGVTAIIYPVFLGTYLRSAPTMILYLECATIILVIFLTIVIKIQGGKLLIERNNPSIDDDAVDDKDDKNVYKDEEDTT